MSGISFSGPYQSWDLASSQSLGYDKEEILEKTLNTVLKVKSGELAYERDSVGFEKPSFNWPLLAALREEALRSNSHLHVIDFGGSLGSAYFQHLSMLSLCNLKWNIIERKQIVDAGQRHLADETLGFFESLELCDQLGKVNFILLSGVLQYLREPEVVIDSLLQLNANSIFIDKTIVNHSDINHIYVQDVPPSIYEGSYPCRSFSENWLLANFDPSYAKVADFSSLSFPALKSIKSKFKGYLLEKK